MNVVRCDDSHQAQWNAFVASTPGASMYHRYEWRAVNQASFGHASVYLGAFENEQLVGILPMVNLRSRLFGNLACSLPFVNYAGPCALSRDIERRLVRAAAEVCEEWNVQYLELRTRHLVESPELSVATHKVSLNVSLDADPDVLWNGFKSAHRQEVRRGYKNGFSARFGGEEMLDDFFVVLAESWRDLGTPIFRKDYPRSIIATFQQGVRICVVYSGQIPVAAAFDGLHGDTVEGMWLGMRSQYRAQYVGYVLYWELIKDACLRGFRRFHLGRSTAESGGEAFKRKWNADISQLYWHYLLRGRDEIPQLNVSNPKYRVAMNAWRKLPVPVTEFLGPFIARSIP